MTDPVSVANLALSLLAKTGEAVNGLRERSKRSKDADIKERISSIYDSFLDLKEVVSRLIDENKKLLDQAEHRSQRPTLRQVGDTNYYFRGGEGPFCQRCYDGKDRLVALLPSEPWNGGIRRECTVCGGFFYEKRMSSNPIRVVSRRSGGPNSWME
jgi:hypothetical protein